MLPSPQPVHGKQMHQARMMSRSHLAACTLRCQRIQMLATAWSKAQQSQLRCNATASVAVGSLEALNWDHSFVRELPGDQDTKNVVRQVTGALYTRVHPTPAAGEPRLLAYSSQVARLIGLDPSECERPEFPLIFSGAAQLPGSQPYAQNYGGHQFGQWAGQLGDGRAISLGEVLAAPLPGTDGTADSKPSNALQRWELQLKGAGKTPYSRRADGRAVLRSSLREFVISEAMAALGVPTTRALSLVATGDAVLRDMFYNGNAKYEPGAVVCRVAPSFVRFGTFQLPASRGGQEDALVGLLADYIIHHHYPHLIHDAPATQETKSHGGKHSKEVYTSFFKEVCERTGRLVAQWQALGFVHGVLNTDNMSILGLTIDYGPFGFLDSFDPYYTPNITDMDGRRYAYRNQPEAVHFNLVQLANALLAAGLLDKEPAETALSTYSEVTKFADVPEQWKKALGDKYESIMAAKLGLRSYDKTLSAGLMQLMYDDDADFTCTYRALSTIKTQGQDDSVMPAQLRSVIGNKEFNADREQAWCQWLRTYRARSREEGMLDAERAALQDAVNPKYIPRQHLLQYAIEAAERGDTSELHKQIEILERPYDEQPDVDTKYCTPPPEDMIKPGVCMLSCSS